MINKIKSLGKEIKKLIVNNKGFTLEEVMVTLGVVSVFLTSVAFVLISGSRIYIHQSVVGNEEVALETLLDDIKGYVMYGKDTKLIYVVSEADINNTAMWESIFGTGFNADTQLVENDVVEYQSEEGTIKARILDSEGNVKRDDFLGIEASNIVGNGLDLGFRKIYVNKTGASNYINGLPYGENYYRNMEYTLKITRELNGADWDKYYNIELSSVSRFDYITLTSRITVGGLGE
jgi:prepilin-type N-terminal cleavage/methylation domain